MNFRKCSHIFSLIHNTLGIRIVAYTRLSIFRKKNPPYATLLGPKHLLKLTFYSVKIYLIPDRVYQEIDELDKNYGN